MGLAGLALLIIMGFGLKSLMGGAGGPQQKPPKISLIPATPPPPPPPPKEEKKPEPPKEQREAKVEQQEQKPTPPTPEAEKVMDGPKGDGPSDFKAGTVTREDYSGKRDGGGGGRQAFAFYTNMLVAHFQDELTKNKKLRTSNYRVSLRIWLARDGTVQRVEMADTTGNPDTDANLKSALAELRAVREPPPENMPQPLRLRITSRGAG
jgi:protein TonB